jgi:uncharacterized protein (DUF2141 family)
MVQASHHCGLCRDDEYFSKGIKMKRNLIKLTAAIAFVFAGTTAWAATLSITIEGASPSNSYINVALHDKAATFLGGAPLRTTRTVAVNSAKVSFTDLPPGNYAVSVFHDENGDGTLNANPFGMPIERYGFSRDAAGHMGPPSFSDASISLEEANQEIVIHLR